MHCDLLIIGGGVSGFSAAITAARRGLSVCILERGKKPLRKLSASGNGRGNLLNLHPSRERYHGSPNFAMKVLGSHPAEEVLRFWKSIGVSTCILEDELVYPSSLWAQSAVDAMRLSAERLGVLCVPGAQVSDLRFSDRLFTARGMQTVFASPSKKRSRAETENIVSEAQWQASNVLVSGGGRASLREDEADSYSLLTGFGHLCTPLFPALCAVCTVQKPDDELQGVRLRCECSLLRGQLLIRSSRGEALFTKDGVSGIAVMDLARHARAGDTLCLNLRQAICGFEEGDTYAWIQERCALFSDLDCSSFFTGAAHPALARELLRRGGINENKPVSELLDSEKHCLADCVEHCRFVLQAVRPLPQAQVTAGGIQTDSFDSSSMQSKLCPGLFAAGEILDVDGDCGGFNLLFAVLSGIRAGAHACEALSR